MINSGVQLNSPLQGEIKIPGDKSITHRAIIFSALAKGQSHIRNPLLSEDCMKTMQSFVDLGVTYQIDDDNNLVISSPGIDEFKHKEVTIDLGNSGTSLRLLTGLFASIDGLVVHITGDESLSKRPMKRVIKPLKLMGAKIDAQYHSGDDEYTLPMTIYGKSLRSIDYEIKEASAQVKSSLIFAGLLNDQGVTLYQQAATRNHTEIMVNNLYADHVIVEKVNGQFKYTVKPINRFLPLTYSVPSDVSSAAFIIIHALLNKGSNIELNRVGLNPTRNAIINYINKVIGNDDVISIKNISVEHGETIGNIIVQYSSNHHGITIQKNDIPNIIDEIPILSVLLSQSKGESKIEHVNELIVKESNRLAKTIEILEYLNTTYDVIKNGDGDITLIINPDVNEWSSDSSLNEYKSIKPSLQRFIKQDKQNNEGIYRLQSEHDHRIAMSGYIASSVVNKPIQVIGDECIQTSFPTFKEIFDL